jgi:hypothetical protein
VTIWNSGLIVTWVVGPPVFPELSRGSPVKEAPGTKGSSFLVSMPKLPITSSCAAVVVAVGPTLGAIMFPVAVAVRSRRDGPPRPVNSLVLIARAAADGCVTVMASPATSGVVSMLEHSTARTPVVVEPFVTSASTVYVLPFVSWQATAPPEGSMAKVTIVVLPAAAPAVSVIERDVAPAIELPATPRSFTQPIAASAPDADATSNSNAPARRSRAASRAHESHPCRLPDARGGASATVSAARRPIF